MMNAAGVADAKIVLDPGHPQDLSFAVLHAPSHGSPPTEPGHISGKEMSLVAGEKPWRLVTSEHALAAITGTNLEPIVAALASPTVPTLPPEITIPKALALAGANLSKPVPGWTCKDHGATGADLARYRINTGSTGQIPVIWTLTVGRTGTGKDIGDMVPLLAARFASEIGTLASSAGLYEVLEERGSGLLTVSEFEAYLDKRSSRATARCMMTTVFNQYTFDIRLSRGSRKSSRYAALNIVANIQPHVLAHHARRIDMDSGFLPRFLISTVPESAWRPSSGRQDLSAAMDALAAYDRICGEVTPPDNYLGDLRDLFSRHGADPRICGRYVNEYGPRIASILQANGQEIREENWRRAEVLIQWFYGMAETALGDTLSGKETSRFDRDLDALHAYVRRMTTEAGGVTRTRISRNWGRGTAAHRDRLLAELVERGTARCLPDGRYVATGSPEGDRT